MIPYLNSARCLACLAVVMLHTSAYYAGNFSLPFSDWMIANILDSSVRWAVPTFIMMSGMLLIREKFEIGYFLKRRIAKVVIPFLSWSIIYSFLNSIPEWSPYLISHFNTDLFFKFLKNIPIRPVHYHLGFFYYFIPLYVVVPFLYLIFNALDESRQKYIFIVASCLTLLPVLNMTSYFTAPIYIYTLYMIVAYSLKVNLYIKYEKYSIYSFVIMVAVIALGTWYESHMAGKLIEKYYEYRTLPIFVCSISIIAISKRYLSKYSKVLTFFSRNSFGVFLIHPIFLGYSWKLQISLFNFPPLASMLFMFSSALIFSTLFTCFLRWSRFTRWLVP